MEETEKVTQLGWFSEYLASIREFVDFWRLLWFFSIPKKRVSYGSTKFHLNFLGVVFVNPIIPPPLIPCSSFFNFRPCTVSRFPPPQFSKSTFKFAIPAKKSQVFTVHLASADDQLSPVASIMNSWQIVQIVSGAHNSKKSEELWTSRRKEQKEERGKSIPPRLNFALLGPQ